MDDGTKQSLGGRARRIRKSDIGSLVLQAARRIEARLAARLAALDLTVDESAALALTLERGPIAPADVASWTGMRVDVADRVLAALTARGLVDCSGSRPDAPLVRATEAAWALAPPLLDAIEDASAEARERLAAGDEIGASAALARLL